MPAIPHAVVRTSIDVPAPRAAVWDVLVDGPAHAEWNPFVRRLDGALAPGSRLEVVVQPSGSRPMRGPAGRKGARACFASRDDACWCSRTGSRALNLSMAWRSGRGSGRISRLTLHQHRTR